MYWFAWVIPFTEENSDTTFCVSVLRTRTGGRSQTLISPLAIQPSTSSRKSFCRCNIFVTSFATLCLGTEIPLPPAFQLRHDFTARKLKTTLCGVETTRSTHAFCGGVSF